MVDDGSTDNPAAVVESLTLPFRHRFIRQQNAGLAVTRNRGAAEASGSILLFYDQDMIAAPQLVQAHLACHRAHEHALVAGRRVPFPGARVSPVMRVLDLDSNDIFAPDLLATWPFQIVIGANHSLPVEDFEALGGYDIEYPPGEGFEDVDLAYRAQRSGMEIVFCREAVASHNHPKDLAGVCQGARRYNRSAPVFFSKHPELRTAIPYLVDKQPIAWGQDSASLVARKVLRLALATPPVLGGMTRLARFLESRYPSSRLLASLYWKILGSYQLLGLREGRKRLAR